jgi:mannose-6-phosphate isomerase-like protein (cupin superfamily)
MRTRFIASIFLFSAFSTPLYAQSRGVAAGRGPITFAIAVADPSGAPVRDVKMRLTGASSRTTRIQGGRVVLEGLRTGNYLFRFEKAGFVTFEREVSARGSKPIDVKVRLTPLSAPMPMPSGPLYMDAKFVVLDMPAFIEKNYVGREAGKATPLGCAAGGAGTLLQIKDPIAQHAHNDADEFIYVIAGKGTLTLADREEPLSPAVFLMIPRRTSHTLTSSSKKPLVIMSVRAGESCASAATQATVAAAR